MKLEVKLYFYHDLALVSLYRARKLCFSRATKLALKAFAEGRRISICPDLDTQAGPMVPVRRTYHFAVVLDEKEDEAVINYLGRIAPGYRNSFVKTLLRYCIFEFPEEYFQEGKDKEKFDQMIQAVHDVPSVPCGFVRKPVLRRPKKKEETPVGASRNDSVPLQNPLPTSISPENAGMPNAGKGMEVLTDGRGGKASEWTEAQAHPFSTPGPAPKDSPGEMAQTGMDEEDITKMFLDITG